MGGFMQPQGHVQVLMNMVEFGMNVQQALDAPRICIEPDRIVMEDGINEHVIQQLIEMGHHEIDPCLVKGYQRILFGKGQIIQRLPNTSTLAAGSDPRGDGHALAY